MIMIALFPLHCENELFHVIVLQIVDSNKLIGDCRNDVIICRSILDDCSVVKKLNVYLLLIASIMIDNNNIHK
ncbi:hypothetical protein BLOT_010443 [Blomia tropicalis]|nr:hypothetical protein BLOT_010443 [Blomia tropicalis]